MGAGQKTGDREATFNLISQVAIKGGYAGLSGPNPDKKNIFEFEFGDFTLENYNPHPHIKAPISV